MFRALSSPLRLLGEHSSNIYIKNSLGETNSYSIIHKDIYPVDKGFYCILFEDRYIPTNTGEIFYCTSHGQWLKYSPIECVVAYDRNSEEYVIKFNPIKNIFGIYPDSSYVYLIDEETATILGFNEYINIRGTYVWYRSQDGKESIIRIASNVLESTQYKRLSKITTTHKANKDNPAYNMVEAVYCNLDIPITVRNLETINNLIGSLSFGVEFETVEGNVPPLELGKLGLVPVEDGSLPSGAFEYCTLPLKGTRGLQTLYNTCNKLSACCRVGISCSLHLNIGGIEFPTDFEYKQFIVSFYTLYQRLQTDILAFLPAYVANPVAIAGKRKMYADTIFSLSTPKDLMLHNEAYTQYIEESYKRIFELFLGCKYGKIKETDSQLPWGEASWRIASRYYQINLINFLTGSSKRIEFRVHPPTLNVYKVFAWLLICVAIIKYAKRNPLNIINSRASNQKITLLEVIRSLAEGAESIVSINIVESLADYTNHFTALRLQEQFEALERANSRLGGLEEKNQYLVNLATQEFREDANFRLDHIL